MNKWFEKYNRNSVKVKASLLVFGLFVSAERISFISVLRSSPDCWNREITDSTVYSIKRG